MNNGNRTQRSTIRSVIIREYDYRPTSDDTKVSLFLGNCNKYYNFQGLLSRMWFCDLNSAQIFHWLSQRSDYNCPITRKWFNRGVYRPIRVKEIVILMCKSFNRSVLLVRPSRGLHSVFTGLWLGFYRDYSMHLHLYMTAERFWRNNIKLQHQMMCNYADYTKKEHILKSRVSFKSQDLNVRRVTYYLF